MADEKANEQGKELYAHAGLALYWAQCFEKSLENLLYLCARVSGNSLTLEELEALDRELEKQTLGRLLADARKLVTFGADAEELLGFALGRRNFLVHRFFKAHADDAMTSAGRELMIAELIEIQKCFQTADLPASVGCKALGKILGISDEMIEHDLQQLKSDWIGWNSG